MYALEESLQIIPQLLGRGVELKNYFSATFVPLKNNPGSKMPAELLQGLLPVSTDKHHVHLLAVNGEEFGTMWRWTKETALLTAAVGGVTEMIPASPLTFLQWYNAWLDVDIARLSSLAD